MKKEKFHNREILNNISDNSNIPSTMTEDEMAQLLEYFSDYKVKLPDEDEINHAMDSLKSYMPQREDYTLKTLFPLNKLKNLIFISFSYGNRLYAILVGIIYIIGYFVTQRNGISPYMTMLFLAPLPFITGIMDAIKGREDGMLELEMSCRISGRQFAFAKLLLVGGYSLLLNLLFSLVLVCSGSAIIFWRITIFWVTPFIFISGVALWTTTRVRGYYASGIFAFIWMIIAYTICLSPNYVQKFLNFNISMFFLIVGIGLAFLIKQFRNFYLYLSFIYEGNDYIET